MRACNFVQVQKSSTMDPLLQEFLLRFTWRPGHEPACVKDGHAGVRVHVAQLLGRENEWAVVPIDRHSADSAGETGKDEGGDGALEQHG